VTDVPAVELNRRLDPVLRVYLPRRRERPFSDMWRRRQAPSPAPKGLPWVARLRLSVVLSPRCLPWCDWITYPLLGGALEVLNDAGTALVGGHTGERAELALGFAINGLVERDRLLKKRGMQEGDRFILTTPIGTGTLFAADMLHKAKGPWIQGALTSMLEANRVGAQCLHRYRCKACTDVTGFGLLWHLVEMVKPAGVDVELDLNAIPLLYGAVETVAVEITSSLQPQNVRPLQCPRNNPFRFATVIAQPAETG